MKQKFCSGLVGLSLASLLGIVLLSSVAHSGVGGGGIVGNGKADAMAKPAKTDPSAAPTATPVPTSAPVKAAPQKS